MARTPCGALGGGPLRGKSITATLVAILTWGLQARLDV
jgi:hypothetical protein